MSAIEIDLDNYLDECIETIENAGYKVVKDQNFEGLSGYVAEMEKNLYIYSHKEFKTYEQIYEDLKNILREVE